MLIPLVRWQQSLSRFKHIFGLTNRQRYKDIQLYYIAGNHDIGYASLHSFKPEVLSHVFSICLGILNEALVMWI